MKQCRHCRLDHSGHTKRDQTSVDANDTPVILVDLVHQTITDFFECYHNTQIIRTNRDICNFSCKFCPVTDCNTDIGC